MDSTQGAIQWKSRFTLKIMNACLISLFLMQKIWITDHLLSVNLHMCSRWLCVINKNFHEQNIFLSVELLGHSSKLSSYLRCIC